MSIEVNQITPDMFTRFPNGVHGVFESCVLQAPGLEIAGGSGSALVSNANAFALRQRVLSAFGVENNAVFSSPVSANATFPVLGGGNLAFDNGTVPQTTNSCRVYTFIGHVNTITSLVTIIAIEGADFPKHRPSYATDSNLGDGTGAIIGYLYVKNESSAVFIPGTTHLDASGITAIFTDAYGWVTA